MISFDTYDSAVATGYVIGEKFEMEVMMAFPSISSTCFAENGAIIQMTQFDAGLKTHMETLKKGEYFKVMLQRY